jgi:hypothetical protein
MRAQQRRQPENASSRFDILPPYSFARQMIKQPAAYAVDTRYARYASCRHQLGRATRYACAPRGDKESSWSAKTDTDAAFARRARVSSRRVATPSAPVRAQEARRQEDGEKAAGRLPVCERRHRCSPELRQASDAARAQRPHPFFTPVARPCGEEGMPRRTA